MAIHRSDPLRELHRMQERMNRMFEEMLTRTSAPGVSETSPGAAWRPPTDLFEESGRYVVRADLPGVEAADVEVVVEQGRLILRGERKRDEGVSEDSYLRVERPDGHFLVQISLPPSVDSREIQARHSNGVLEVSLPKRREDATGRIEIAVGA